MWQRKIELASYSKGFHEITDIINSRIPDEHQSGMLFINILHTSAALTINENADPDVLHDLKLYYQKIVPENLDGMKHTLEGSDDMPAHVMSTLTGSGICIPLMNGEMILGTWQGVYLCEFRNSLRTRKIILTIIN